MATKEITHKLICVGAEKEHLKNVDLGIIPYKDSNGLIYFEESSDGGIIEGPQGVYGFHEIYTDKDFVKCKRGDGLYSIYLRGKKKWLAYRNSGTSSEVIYHFYGDGIIYSDDSIMQVVTENCNTGLHKEFAIYLLNEDRFVPDINYTLHICGIFEPNHSDLEIEMRMIENSKQKTIFLNRKRYDDRNPYALYLVETNKFFRIPYPKEFQDQGKEEQKTPRFYFISGKYAVIKLRNQKSYNDNFHLYDLVQKKYLNFDKEHDTRLDEKYWKPQQMLCTEDKVCIQYILASSKGEAYWEILSAGDWKLVKLNFNYEVKSDVFSQVSVQEDAGIITAYIKPPDSIYTQL